jgi:geranyl-CoA carboxylase beta subunit
MKSALKVGSPAFLENQAAMLSKLGAVRAIEQNARKAELKYSKKAQKKQKLLPRERLELLLDKDMPYLELMSIAGYQMYGDEDGSLAGGSMIAGIGFVSGVCCIVVSNNYAVKGGTMTAVSVKKTMRLQEISLRFKLPMVTLNESGGGNLADAGKNDPWVSYMFIEGGRCFCNQAQLSAAGIPQVTVVHGNATAGGAYQPGLSDYIILVKNQSNMFLAGPPLLKAATGQIATAEELGGADMHASVSGTGEYFAESDAEGISIARKIMLHLRPQSLASPAFAEPKFCPSELIGIVPANKKEPYDCKEIMIRLVDGSDLLEFKAKFDFGTVCAFGHIGGQNCGFLGNNGPITPQGAAKAAQFIQLCDMSSFPLIFLQNTTGFMVGTAAEQSGAIKHGSKMIQAVANARVPKITFVVGNSYGAGNYAMCSRSLKPEFIFAWPSARTAVMGGEQAGQVLRIIGEQKLKGMGQDPNEEANRSMLDSMAQSTMEGLEHISGVEYTSARMFDDGIIDPRDTRQVLLFVLRLCKEADLAVSRVRPNTFGIARL